MPYFLPIDEDCGFDVGTFQKQSDALSFPVLWHVELAFVPCVAHVVLFGGEEEREFHFAFLAILLHVGVKVVTGVVERACPRGVDIHVVAFVVGQHGTWQHHVVVVNGLVVHGKTPHACEVDDLLSVEREK